MLGILVLVTYALLTIGATVIFTRKTNDVERFNVANRSIGPLCGAISVAATWIWAPSLFVSAERAYGTGIPGMFWFLVPNVLCLIIFIPFAKRMRSQFPAGITLSGYMGKRYSQKVQGIYQFQLGALAVLSASVQLLAGSKMVSLMTGLPFFLVSVILAAIAFAYAQFSGIRASVTADIAKIVVVFGGLALILPMALSASGGVATLAQGLGGRTGDYTALFSGKGLDVLFGFGIPTAIGLMSGPFGDQSFWQRAFAVRKKRLGAAFFGGALIFAVVPLCMGAIGFLAAGAGFDAADPGVVNLEYISAMLPQWVLVPLLFMVIAGLLSVVGSNLCATAALMSDKSGDVKKARAGMVALLVAAVAIANVPGLMVTHLFLFYGTLRASTLLPTVMTLLGKRLRARAVFYGILVSLCIGLPIFAYGNIANDALFKTIGSLVTVTMSGLIAALASRKGVQKA
jgi:Na+/proline symporter